ncbi:isocitrate lyase/PEP mutase family protein [Nocardia suismassiliense]|uniref:isocitrate lyase/PEP mutase family protein n=1 Tax=Nocardia suismassiliense TaxID=2077092 RepID=UPI000D1D85D2|nr:isocitrate lyase/PEP mutase family protein [Nocardia suismassiliense]
MDAPARLRQLIAASGMIQAPGAYDGISARLVAQAGFPAVYATGFGAAASALGMPDVGLMTMDEMVRHAAAMVEAIPATPIIADADTGYGGPTNVRRTVREYQRAGVAGIHLEDQVWPKRCGHLAGKKVIDRAEAVNKVRAAVDARDNDDFVIIARTDANSVLGFDEALRRADAFREAGADMILIEAPRSETELAEISARYRGTPLVFNWIDSGRMCLPPLPEIERLGFKVVLYSVATLFAATHQVTAILKHLFAGSDLRDFLGQDSFDGFIDRVGMAELQQWEQKYETPQVS